MFPTAVVPSPNFTLPVAFDFIKLADAILFSNLAPRTFTLPVFILKSVSP